MLGLGKVHTVVENNLTHAIALELQRWDEGRGKEGGTNIALASTVSGNTEENTGIGRSGAGTTSLPP